MDQTDNILDNQQSISEEVESTQQPQMAADAPSTEVSDASVDDKKPKKKKKEKKPHKPLVKKFDLYIIRKFLGTFIYSIVLLFVVITVFDANEKLDSILNAPVKDTVFGYFMNVLPYFANQFAPVILFIAVIFFTSKLADHSEITAILSSGISYFRLTIPYLVSAAIVASCTLYLSLYVIPPANVKRIEYTNKWVKNKAVDYGDNIQLQLQKGVMMHMVRYDNITKHGSHISIEKFDGTKITTRLTANEAVYDTLGRWKLSSWQIRTFDGIKEHLTTGEQMDTVLNFKPKDFLIAKNDQEMLTSPELKKYIEDQKKRGASNIQQFEIEYENRFAMTAAAFILTIIGLSLSSRKVRGGMGLNIGIGLALGFSYILFMKVTQSFALNDYTSPRVAMWIPNILYTIIAVVLFKRASR